MIPDTSIHVALFMCGFMAGVIFMLFLYVLFIIGGVKELEDVDHE